jgi:hypothetical protein
MLPHDLGFRYRTHLFALALLACLVVNFAIQTDGANSGLVDIALVIASALVGYLAMRLFVSANTGVMLKFPRLARAWALSWFYGAIPLSVIALYVGSKRTGAPPPDLPFAVCVAAVALGFAAGASKVFGLLSAGSNNPLEPTR